MLEHAIGPAWKIVSLLIDKFARWRRHRAEFDSARRAVLYAGLANERPVRLHELRALMIERGWLDSSASCQRFFRRWLTHPLVVMGIPALNTHTNTEWAELEQDLGALTL